MEPISQANVSFSFLKESSDFLNLIISNISSCVMLLDGQMRLHAYNDPLTTIFSNRAGESLQYIKCGNAIGCAYAIEEEKECDTSSKCLYCELRETVLLSFNENRAIYKQRIDREFYNKRQIKELKHLQFSTRLFHFKNDNYIILIIDDITKLINQQELLIKHEEVIRKLTKQQNIN